MDAAKKKLCTHEAVQDFFRDLEAIPFPTDIIAESCPGAVERWQQIAATQSVPWMWVMAAELVLSGFLAPTAVLFPVQSITVYPLLWLFFLHPGSTQTSGLVRLYANVFDNIEARAREDRRSRHRAWAAAHPPGQALGGGGIRRQRNAGGHGNPYSGDLHMTQSAGSLEGEGKNMAQPQNMGRSCGFMAEGKRLFRWLAQEGGVNESIVTELHERFKWKRQTLQGDRSFEIPFPYFGACGALHVPDIAHLFLGDDPLGIRGRILLFYTRPEFKKAGDVRAANAIVNADRSLGKDLTDFFWRVHVAHTPLFAGEDRFELERGYLFRVYSLIQQGSVQTRYYLCFRNKT